jgi:hypothetical protein
VDPVFCDQRALLKKRASERTPKVVSTSGPML